MRPNKKNRSVVRARKRRIVERLTYDPLLHKQKSRKLLRQELMKRWVPDAGSKPVDHDISMRFGSMNVDGIDLQVHWAASELIKKYDLDVS